MNRNRRKTRHRPGFIAADVLGGLMIIGVLTLGVVTAVYHHQRAMNALARQKQAVALAEIAAASLQSGAGLPESTPETRYSLQRLEEAEPLAQHVWVRVRVEHRGVPMELVAVVYRRHLEDAP